MSNRPHFVGKAALAAAIAIGAAIVLPRACLADGPSDKPADKPAEKKVAKQDDKLPQKSGDEASMVYEQSRPKSEEVHSEPFPSDIQRASFHIDGFAMVDTIFDFAGAIDPNWRDAFRVSKIPVPQTLANGQASISAKQSRINFNGYSPNGIHGRIEFDFYGTGADAGQFTIRPRHIYGEQGHWLGGQTNSVFMDGDVWPNILDYWGPVGMVFYRLPQVRYQSKHGNGSFALAIELPETGLDPGRAVTIDPSLGNVTRHEVVPDFAAHYRWDGDWGHAQISGIITNVGYQTPGNPEGKPHDTLTGFGISGGGALKVAKNDWLWAQINYGEGMNNFMNDAGGNDIAANGNGGADTLPTFAWLVYYGHSWTKKLSSAIGYSENGQDNAAGQLGSAFKKVKYFSANLINQADPNLMYGIEYLWGQRNNRDGGRGELSRFQASMQWKFSSK
jgi:hypothetical protein